MKYKEKKSDPELLAHMAKPWFEREHENGKYWGWMDLINKFHMQLNNDM